MSMVEHFFGNRDIVMRQYKEDGVYFIIEFEENEVIRSSRWDGLPEGFPLDLAHELLNKGRARFAKLSKGTC